MSQTFLFVKLSTDERGQAQISINTITPNDTTF